VLSLVKFLATLKPNKGDAYTWFVCFDVTAARLDEVACYRYD